MDNKALKTGIISGVISSVVIIIFINPILSFVWKVTIAVAGSLRQGYVDRIYRGAALPDYNFFGILTVGAVLVFGLYTTMFIVFDFRSKVQGPFNSSFGKFRRYILYVYQVNAMIFIIIFLIDFSLAVGILKIASSFTQRLTVLAPAIDDNEYKALKAQWAGMQSKADYDKIVAAMDKRAKELSVMLPPVRVP